MNLTNKNLLVLGLGESGRAAARLALSKGAHVTVCDEKSGDALQTQAQALIQAGAAVRLNADEGAVRPGNWDLIVTSPGVPPRSALLQAAQQTGAPLIGELELAWNFCKCPVVAVTGTNGKTTTTELITAILEQAGRRVLAAGNIGTAFSEVVDKTAGLDAVVLEVSSFQLETIRAFHPRVSVYLNLTPDHLDWHASLEEYRAAKWRIFENQTPEDVAVVQAGAQLPAGLRARQVTFRASEAGADFSFKNGQLLAHGKAICAQVETALMGQHNVENMLAATAAAEALGVPVETAAQALRAYQPKPHRCERVAEIGGVLFINDSKATNIDALEKALVSMTRPAVLIAGGKDKGLDFAPLGPLVQKTVRACILIGQMTEKLRALWSSLIPCEAAKTLPDAVRRAAVLARSGDVVLLSPGCSSFDMFSGYEERGRVFCEAVRALQREAAAPSTIAPKTALAFF